MPAGDEERWNARWSQATPGAAARVLTEHAHLLPPAGRALDLACGLGSNAVFLCERGLDVQAWDVSSVAVDRTAARLAGRGVACRRDVIERPPEPGSFDVVLVVHFLERALAPALNAALRPGGLLLVQTFTRERVSDRGPGRDAFRLAPGELLALHAGLQPVVYREEGRLGDLAAGWRDEAMLVARKPAAR